MENIFGIIGGIFGISSLIPQAMKSYKTKKTRDLSKHTFIFIAICNSFWLVHGLIRGDMVLVLTNAVAVMLAISIVSMKHRYK